MSTSTAIIEDAYRVLGVNSDVSTVDAALVTKGFTIWQSVLADLLKEDIVLEETVSGTTTTIAVPALIGDELNEPLAARNHLVNYLAMFLIQYARVPVAGLTVPPLIYSKQMLENKYKVHIIPNKVMPSLLPRGQGGANSRTNDTFFDGQTIADDVTSSV